MLFQFFLFALFAKKLKLKFFLKKKE